MPEKILIVDDDVDTLRLVGLMLQRQGYQITAASNGTQALSLAQAEKPDLIILDVMMPDLDGYEVTRRLRSNPGTAAIPIIMFTAKSQVDDKVTGFEVGADDYLTKPTQPRELFAHVKAVLARGSKNTAPAQAVLGEKGTVIGILAAKGGLGLSTLALNLGVAVHARHKKEVLVAELRPGEGSLGLELGYTQPDSLANLLQKNPSEITLQIVENELTSHSSGLRLLLSSYQPQDAQHTQNTEGYEAIVRFLAYLGETVLLDLGPALPLRTEKTLSLCDSIILVTEPIPTTITRTKTMIDDLVRLGFGKGRMIITMVSRQRTEMQLSWSQAQEKLGHPIDVTFTPAPEQIYQAVKANVPVIVQHPESMLAQQFYKLADQVAKLVRQKA
jgi:DNA-binding response OmpR family regulator